MTIAATTAIAAPALANPGMPAAEGHPLTQDLLAQDRLAQDSAGGSSDLCRKILTPPEGLNIRAKATSTSAIVGGVGKGETVTLTTSPATTQKEGSRTWVQISAPAAGWISNGVMSPGHLIMCGTTPAPKPEPKPEPKPTGSRCRRVINPPEGLVIKSDASRSSSTVGGLALGEKMTLSNDPATTKKDGEGRTWMQIESPQAGWVSNGFGGGKGNVGMCP
jgi:hypothetical protein